MGIECHPEFHLESNIGLVYKADPPYSHAITMIRDEFCCFITSIASSAFVFGLSGGKYGSETKSLLTESPMLRTASKIVPDVMVLADSLEFIF